MENKKNNVGGIILIVAILVITAVAGYFLYVKNDSETVYDNDLSESFLIASNAFNSGDLDKSINLFEKAVKTNPEDTNMLLAYSLSLAQKGSLEFKEEEYGKKALDVANEIIKVNPKYNKGYFAQGYAYEIMEKYPEALKSYNKSLKLAGDADVLNQLGHVYDLMGNNEKSLEFYLKANSLNPESVKIRANLARIYLAQEDYEKAIENLNFVVTHAENNRVMAEAEALLGAIALKYNDFQKAEQFMIRSSKSDDTFPTAWVGRGQIEFNKALDAVQTGEGDSLKSINEAVIYFDKAIELNPNQTTAYFSKARLLFAMGETETAQEIYLKALDVIDNDITLMNDEKEILRYDIVEEMRFYKLYSTKEVGLVGRLIELVVIKNAYAAQNIMPTAPSTPVSSTPAISHTTTFETTEDLHAYVNSHNSQLGDPESEFAQTHVIYFVGGRYVCNNGVEFAVETPPTETPPTETPPTETPPTETPPTETPTYIPRYIPRYSTIPTYSCVGSVPADAIKCPGWQSPSSNVAWQLVDSCTGGNCEYTIPCSPDCSCEEDILVGYTCEDTCGGFCDGILPQPACGTCVNIEISKIKWDGCTFCAPGTPKNGEPMFLQTATWTCQENGAEIDCGTATYCTQKSCTANGTCQSTPKSASNANECSSTCNSNADCSTGRLIETRP